MMNLSVSIIGANQYIDKLPVFVSKRPNKVVRKSAFERVSITEYCETHGAKVTSEKFGVNIRTLQGWIIAKNGTTKRAYTKAFRMEVIKSALEGVSYSNICSWVRNRSGIGY